ncbi:MAG: DUF1501 domain-containing protein [Gemmataceae bacterium]
MHTGHELLRHSISRRTFLVAGGLSLAGAAQAAPSPGGGRARSTILVWLSGGASHLDTFDMKPAAPVGFRGEFRPAATSAPGVRFCEHLPHLARQAHHLAVINSLGHANRGTGDHHAGYYYNLTGHEPDPTFRLLLNNRRPEPGDWPFIGSVVASKRPAHPHLPSLITLPQKPGAPQFTRPGQFAARLGIDFDPIYLLGNLDRPLEFAAPSLTLEGVTRQRLEDRRGLLRQVDGAARVIDRLATTAFDKQQHKAFTLLGASQTRSAFDLSREPAALRERYGATLNGTSMLMARRLVEAGVPFVSVFWMEDPKLNELCKSGGGWDTHGNNFNCLRDHLLPEFDRAFSALLADLHERGLLDQTLVMVTSEMGRQPRIGDPRSGGVKGAGRDHWTHCMSMLFAGGGIRGGQVYGASDKVGAYPNDRKVLPEDVARTVYHAMGIRDLDATDREGRRFDLMPQGEVISALF